jgi:hypothetical protein
MAEITSGKNLTVIVLDVDEACLLAEHLGHEPTFPSAHDKEWLRKLGEELGLRLELVRERLI